MRGCFSHSQFVCAVRRAIIGVIVVNAGSLLSAQTVVPRPLGAGLVVNRPAYDADPEAPPPTSVENPTGRISLRDALALALRQSPELAGYGWEIRARESAAIQAGQPANPVLEVLFEDLWATGREAEASRAARPQATFQLSQLFELGGKRSARRTLAELDRDLAEWDFEAARIDVLTRVTSAFLDVVVSQRSVALAEQTRALFEKVNETVKTRVEAGVVSPIEETKAGVSLATARIDEQRARRALAADRMTLAALWGQESPLFESAEGDLQPPAVLPDFATLVQHVARNPDVARWATEIARRDAARKLESARSVPDLTVSAGYRRLTDVDSNALVVGASIPLPFLDRNRAGIQASSERIAAAREEERAAKTRVTTALAQLYRDLAAAHDEAAALAASVLPGARSAFGAIEEGYRLGRFGYLDVLDAQRTLVAAEVQHLRALSNVQKAVTQIERLTGVPLSDAASAPVKGQ